MLSNYLCNPSAIPNAPQRMEAIQQYFIFCKKMSDAASRFYLLTLKTSDELQLLEHTMAKNVDLIEHYKKKLAIQIRIFTELTDFVKKLSAPDTLNTYLCKTDMKTQQTEMLLNLTTLTTALSKQPETSIVYSHQPHTTEEEPSNIQVDAGLGSVFNKKRKSIELKQANINEENTKKCIFCFSVSTPVWRTGPAGPKSLCNACGIRFAKKVRSEAEIKKKMAVHSLI